ncbi:MAG TPA: hypothetical protein VMT59_01005 [Gaiellaceae bacterium]|nr:hypothetical protein [Gaiellaceae bacterium]
MIFSTLALLVDRDLLPYAGVDADGYLANALSLRFGQSWLVRNVFSDVAPATFHSDYLRASVEVQSCFLSVVCVDPGRYCESDADLDVFLGTLLHVNRVLRRRVLFLVPEALESAPGGQAFLRWADSLGVLADDTLVSVLRLGAVTTLEEAVPLLADYVART